MEKVQTTLSNSDYKDLRILVEYDRSTVAHTIREFIKDGIDRIKTDKKEYFQNAEKHYEAMERRWGPNFYKTNFSKGGRR